jgi:hypothetical protein
VHIFRTSASHSKQSDPSLLSAKKRLAAILLKNPHKARNLAWHAAQIIAVANGKSSISSMRTRAHHRPQSTWSPRLARSCEFLWAISLSLPSESSDLKPL